MLTFRHAAAFVCAAAAVSGLVSCHGDEPPSTDHDAATTTYRRLRRLSAREYTLVVADLLAEDVSPSRFPPDTLDTGYDNGAANLLVADQAPFLETLAGELASAAVAKHLDILLGGCDVSTKGDDACEKAFFDGFAGRAFRRPLATAERTRLEKLFADAKQMGGGFSAALETTVGALLQSPAFLYREELGQDAGGPTVRLTPYELASELSFFLTGSMPDETLLEAAGNGRFSTAADLEREGARLLATPRARKQLAHFLDEWLVTTRLATTSKDTTVYPQFDAALRASMREELDRYYDEILSNGGTLHDLFESNVSFVDGRLAALYGTAPAKDPNAFEKVTMDPAVRRGIFTRAGFLTVNSGYDYSNPIERGIFVRNAVLCIRPTPPPPNIPRNPPVGMSKTTRQRFDIHTADAFCQTCHKGIDGVGFGFEQFDGTGTRRLMENGVTVDTSGFLYDSGDADGPFVGVSALEDRIAGSARAETCFVNQMFRYAMGRGEGPQDQAILADLSQGFTASTPIGELTLRVVTTRMFQERSKAED